MSDIEFLTIKEFDGKLKSDEGFGNAVGELAAITAGGGKDLYLATAKCSVRLASNVNIAVICRIELRVNGTPIETAHFTMEGVSGLGHVVLTQSYEFVNIGHKVVSGNTISVHIAEVTSNLMQFEGEVSGFEENTGASPAI